MGALGPHQTMTPPAVLSPGGAPGAPRGDNGRCARWGGGSGREQRRRGRGLRGGAGPPAGRELPARGAVGPESAELRGRSAGIWSFLRLLLFLLLLPPPPPLPPQPRDPAALGAGGTRTKVRGAVSVGRGPGPGGGGGAGAQRCAEGLEWGGGTGTSVGRGPAGGGAAGRGGGAGGSAGDARAQPDWRWVLQCSDCGSQSSVPELFVLPWSKAGPGGGHGAEAGIGKGAVRWGLPGTAHLLG